jgi:hypothetical protein
VTPHPALPGLLLATAREPWPAWCAVTRLALADLCEEVGRPAPWLRRGLHAKALARALRRDGSVFLDGGSGMHNCLRLVLDHYAGRPTPPDVAASVGRARRRFRRRALCLFPGVLVKIRCLHCGGLGDLPGVGCVWCRNAGTVSVPAPDLLPREPGRRRRRRRGHAALDRAISGAVLPPPTPT